MNRRTIWHRDMYEWREAAHEAVTKRARLAHILPLILAIVLIGMDARVIRADERSPDALDVPYEPTHVEVVEAMLKLAEVTDADYVVDLGCGDGRVVIQAAEQFGARGLGVDLDPQRLREAVDNAAYRKVSDRVRFQQKDIMVTDIREATVVTLYLLDRVNLMLRPRLFAQLRAGTRVVSHAFHMADWEPDHILRHPRARGNLIYLWIIPARAGGIWRSTTRTPKGDLATVLDLRQHFQALSGSLTVADGEPVTVSDAAVTGELITFRATMPIGGIGSTIVYRGRVSGDLIEGTQEWSDGSSPGVYPWIARRDGVEVEGRWGITVPSHRTAEGILSVHHVDGIPAASWLLADGSTNSTALAFYTWGTSVRFDLPNGDSTLVFTGTLQGERGDGTLFSEDGSRDYAWSAARLQVPQSEPAVDPSSLMSSQPTDQPLASLQPSAPSAGQTAAPAVPVQATRPAEGTGDTRRGPGRPPSRSWDPGMGVPQAGDEYTNPSDRSVLVWIPGGEFTMGSEVGAEDEKPMHAITVTGFWIGKHEVTNRQYALFMAAKEAKPPYFWGREGYNHPDQPVVGVTWLEARAYCDWAGLRLSTEPEWEYAAAGGGQLHYPTIDGNISPTLANARFQQNNATSELPRQVGSYPANPFGIHDLAGNAWEWTLSRFTAYPYDPTDGREDKDSNTLRVLRGGGWCFPAHYCRTAHRHRFAAHLRCDYAGIRVASSQVQPGPSAER